MSLLDQISAGIPLNHVEKTSRSDSKASISSLDTLIMDALARFREDISFSDDDEIKYDEDEDSDWSVYE